MTYDCCWLLLVAAGCCWLLLVAAGFHNSFCILTLEHFPVAEGAWDVYHAAL